MPRHYAATEASFALSFLAAPSIAPDFSRLFADFYTGMFSLIKARIGRPTALPAYHLMQPHDRCYMSIFAGYLHYRRL